MSGKKIITVFGATGAQGGSVADIFLSDLKLKEEWTVRAITRDVSKESAKKLAARGAEVVTANLSDKASLVKVFEGSHTVFVVTSYWEKMDMDYEAQQGKNAADAAKETGVQHFIFSSTINVMEHTKGKLPMVYHFDSKAKVEEYTRTLGIPATYFYAGFYMSNIDGTMMSRQPPDNAWTLALPVPGDTPVPMFYTGDQGKYIKAIVGSRDSLLGERVFSGTAYQTLDEIVAEFREAFSRDGKTARFVSLSHEAFRAFMREVVGDSPAFASEGRGPDNTTVPEYVPEEMLQNMRLYAEYGYYGGASLEPGRKLVEDAGEKLTTWAEYMRTKSEAWKDLK